MLCASEFANPIHSSAPGVAKQKLIDSAKLLYAQYNASIPKLQAAAATGDPESQFILAEELRGRAQYMTTKAYYWYEKAAKQGDFYAMYRLATQSADACSLIGRCPGSNVDSVKWRQRLLDLGGQRAREGDASAMSILYNITGKLKWLESAANHGDSAAQWLLANRYEEGAGWFWPGKRKNRITMLLKASAQSGHPRGTVEYAAVLVMEGKPGEAREWFMKAVEMSYARAVASYAYVLTVENDYGFSKDLKKSYAMYSVLLELNGGGMLYETSQAQMRDLEQHLTPAEIAEALAFAEQWKKTHPPLSFYPTKLGL